MPTSLPRLILLLTFQTPIVLTCLNSVGWAQENNCDTWNTQAFFATTTVHTIQLCIDEGSSLDHRGSVGETPLHNAAAFANDPKIIETLIDEGADTEAVDNENETPIFWALTGNTNSRITQSLVDNGASVISYNDFGDTPVHMVVRSDLPIPLVRTMLDAANNELKESGKSVLLGQHGSSILHNAVLNPHAQGVKDIIETLGPDANFSAKDVDGETPLHWAARWNTNTEVLRALLQHDSQIHLRDFKNNVALHLAAINNSNPEILQLLLADGGKDDPNVRNDEGVTPLHFAAAFNDEINVAKALMEADADVNAKNHSGETPLHWAVRSNSALVSELLNAPATNINVKDDEGATPLHWAARWIEEEDIVELLSQKSAAIDEPR